MSVVRPGIHTFTGCFFFFLFNCVVYTFACLFFFCFRLSNFNHHSLAAPAVTTSVMPHSMEKDCVVLRIEKFHSCRVFVSLFFCFPTLSFLFLILFVFLVTSLFHALFSSHNRRYNILWFFFHNHNFDINCN